MAELPIDMPALTPPLVGLPLGQARRLARKRAQATVEFKLVDSEEKALTVVRQYPEPGDELPESRVIKVEIATRPWISYLPGIYQDADEENADFLQRFLLVSAHHPGEMAALARLLAGHAAARRLGRGEAARDRAARSRAVPQARHRRGPQAGAEALRRREGRDPRGRMALPGPGDRQVEHHRQGHRAFSSGVRERVLHRGVARPQGGDLPRAAADGAGPGGDREARPRPLRPRLRRDRAVLRGSALLARGQDRAHRRGRAHRWPGGRSGHPGRGTAEARAGQEAAMTSTGTPSNGVPKHGFDITCPSVVFWKGRTVRRMQWRSRPTSNGSTSSRASSPPTKTGTRRRPIIWRSGACTTASCTRRAWSRSRAVGSRSRPAGAATSPSRWLPATGSTGAATSWCCAIRL